MFFVMEKTCKDPHIAVDSHPAALMFFMIFELWPSEDNNVGSGFDMVVIQQGIVFLLCVCDSGRGHA